MTNLCTLMTVIVGLAIAIPACNGAHYYRITPINLPYQLQEAIFKIEKMEKQINATFANATREMLYFEGKINEQIFAYQEKERSKIDQQYTSMEQNITNYIRLSKKKGSIENCTDNWEITLETLKNRTIELMISCTYKIEREVSRRFINVTDDYPYFLNYLNEKKDRVKQCVKKYEKHQTVAEHHFAEFCIAEEGTIHEEFYSTAVDWISENKYSIQHIAGWFSLDTSDCSLKKSFVESLEEATDFVNSTTNCIRGQNRNFYQNHETINVYCSGTECPT